MTTPVRRFLAVITMLFLAYGCAIIYSSSFIQNGTRWFCLFDDAMISMRYAHNLVSGHGLVWNPGERVEGFTNPGWTLIMALIHLIEHRDNFTSLWVQIVSMIFLAGTIPLTAWLGVSVGSRSTVAALAASASVAFYFPLNYFSLMGMETGILAFLLTLGLALHARQARLNSVSAAGWLCLGGAVIIRMDGVVPLIAVAFALWFINPVRRRANIFWMTAILLFSAGIPTLLRLWYYHEPLPNTWHLKMTGYPVLPRILRGAYVTGRFLTNHFWPLYALIPFLALYYFKNRETAIAAIHRFRHSSLLLLVAVFFGQIAYSIYVGGDVWERELYANRFLVIIAPIFFLLISQAVIAVISWWPAAHRAFTNKPILWSVVFGLLFVIQSNWHPGYKWAREQAVFLVPLKDTEEAQDFVQLAVLLNRTIPTDSVIAVERAGTLPYFMPDYTFVDILGKTDSVIARQPAHFSDQDGTIRTFVPGHLKYDAAWSLGKLKPDMLVAGLDFRHEDFAPWIEAHYQTMEFPGFFSDVYIRRSSAELLKSLTDAGIIK